MLEYKKKIHQDRRDVIFTTAYLNVSGKYETLLDDSLLTLHTVNASHIQFPRLTHTSGTSEKLRSYFSQLELPLIKKLYKLYKQDYAIFQYGLDNIVGFDLG
jgi:chondroitin 4-sulfotransferase 11